MIAAYSPSRRLPQNPNPNLGIPGRQHRLRTLTAPRRASTATMRGYRCDGKVYERTDRPYEVSIPSKRGYRCDLTVKLKPVSNDSLNPLEAGIPVRHPVGKNSNILYRQSQSPRSGDTGATFTSRVRTIRGTVSIPSKRGYRCDGEMPDPITAEKQKSQSPRSGDTGATYSSSYVRCILIGLNPLEAGIPVRPMECRGAEGAGLGLNPLEAGIPVRPENNARHRVLD